jgi:predicted Zn-dependent protease
MQVSVLLVSCLLLPFSLWGQQPSESSQSLKPAEAIPQAQPAALASAQSPSPQTSETKARYPDAVDKLALPRNAQEFKFTKVDLALLRQVNAFDKYMEERGWIYNEPETNAYLEKLGLSLVPKETPENVQWRFRAIRDIEVNAFALPNGSVYVNSGLLSRMENEAHLAGVLAHEITHVVNRHTYLANRSARKKMVTIDIILAAASAASYGGASPVLVNAMGNILPMIVVSTIFGYNRELEHEADVYAVNTLNLQGYDLREFSRGFELLRKGPEVDLTTEPVFWASHPKLASRVQYVAEAAERLQPNAAGLLVNQPGYRSATVNVIRHNAGLAILLGKPRSAVAIAQRLIEEEPNNAENLVLLGDAYRSLGARTAVPESEELTNLAKNETRKRLQKMTIVEYDKALLADPHGPERWQGNAIRAEEAFRKALAMDPQNATAHRGLGFLYESNGANTDAIEQFKKYQELAPKAKDARQIKMRLESLERMLAQKPVAETPPRIQ